METQEVEKTPEIVCKCGTVKVLSKNNNYYCKPCKDGLNKKERNEKSRILDYSRKNNWILKSGGECNLCGYNKYQEALDFHHIDPKLKSFELSPSYCRSKSEEEIQTEIEKCILLCATCHREVHAQKDTEELREFLRSRKKKILSKGNWLKKLSKFFSQFVV